jgi:CheY-like chemotaxis protein
MQVLVADDDDDIRYVVSALLARKGWSVTTTSNGTETIDLLGTASFDVLVLDQNMPPGSGLEVVDHLRERGDVTPVVLFTGFSAVIDRARTDAAGVLVMEKTDVSSLAAEVAALAGVG